MLEEINGFKILGSYVLPNEFERVILGVRTLQDGTMTEWVVAYCGLPPTTSWGQGHYFTNWEPAFEAYKSRIIR